MGVVEPLGYGMLGAEWQRVCDRVLRQHHGHRYVRVPDTNGDAGIESYTYDGVAYQCYSPKEPLNTDRRYAKLRDKMTEDVGKFIANREKFKGLFGTVVSIKYWILLVPMYDDKRLVQHAVSVQTPRLREACLPYVKDECFVKVETLEEDYEISVRAVASAGLARLNLPQPSAVDYGHLGNDIAIARDKLMKVPQFRKNPSAVAKYLHQLATSYVSGNEHRDFLRDHYPDLAQNIEESLVDLEQKLETEYPLRDDPPNEKLLSVQREAAEAITSAVSTMKARDVSTIALGQVANWLMRCPLDFADAVSSSGGKGSE